MKCDRHAMLLYAVTDRTWTGEKTLYQQVEEALEGGATCVQLREKELAEDDFLREALELKELCRRYGVPFIINDNVRIAKACGADGIHVGQHDMEAGRVRAEIGEDTILGVSVQTREQALLAESSGADYLGVGAVFPTSTKSDADSVSREELRAICAAVSIPVVAIGGIYKHNLLQLSGTGVDGVALVSAIFGSGDVKGECRELRRLSERMTAPIKGAIFDLDGTLLDSMFIWDCIGETYLRSRGLEPKERLNETFKSMSLRQAADYYKSEYGMTGTVEDIMDGVNRMIEHFYVGEVRPKEGAAELLRLFQERGIQMCIATATDRHLVEAALKHNGLLEYFSEIFTCNNVGAGKDEPAIYEEALRQLGTDKDSTLVFEDALYAVETAAKAGFRVVGVFDQSEQPREAEIKEKAERYIRSFDEIRQLI